MTAWGGFNRKVHGVLLGMALSSIFGNVLMGIGQTTLIWFIGSFFFVFFIPIINGSNQAIWQAKVAPGVQGRVFATRRWIAQITAPVAMIIAGPLADFVFEPALQPGGSLSLSVGRFVGVGPGAGMGFMFVITGVLGLIIGLGAYIFPAIRNVEEILPDHEAAHTASVPPEDVPEPAPQTTEAPA